MFALLEQHIPLWIHSRKNSAFFKTNRKNILLLYSLIKTKTDTEWLEKACLFYLLYYIRFTLSSLARSLIVK